MSEYPTSPAPSYPVDIDAKWNTLISKFDSGTEQRRQKQIQPLFDVTLTYKLLEQDEMQLLWDFYQERRGSWESFYFYSLESDDWGELYVGVGDGSTVTFDLPGKTTSSQSIYIDGALQGAGYSIVTGGGAENSDRVTFSAAPAVNKIITCSFTGYLRIKCRFEQDKLTRSRFQTLLYTTGIKLIGLPV